MFALPAELARQDVWVETAQNGDIAFQRVLFETARRDLPFIAHWPAPERGAFLDSQFSLQSRHYAMAHAGADFLIVKQRGTPVGRLILDRRTRDWCLVDIAFLPAVRGQGFGAAFLRAIQAAAIAAGAAEVNLHVEVGNPAQALYARFGFVETESESGMHVAMRWPVS